MKTSRFLISSLLAAFAVFGAVASSAWADESSGHLKFSDPTKPGTLKVNIMGGDLRIEAADTSEVTVVSDAKANSSQKRSDGLRVLTAATTYTFGEKDNVITLEAGYNRRHGSSSSFKVTVPRNTAIVVSNPYGDTVCTNPAGDVEVRSTNGSVTLKDISGGASVETMNGTIHVGVKTLTPDHALSFSSMNGEIVIHLPGASKANLQLRTQNGTILTDFDENDLVAKTTSEGTNSTEEAYRDAVRKIADAARRAADAARRAAHDAVNGSGSAAPIPPLPPLPPLPPMTGGQIVSGILHGGGTEVQAATMNGDVTVRKDEKIP